MTPPIAAPMSFESSGDPLAKKEEKKISQMYQKGRQGMFCLFACLAAYLTYVRLITFYL